MANRITLPDGTVAVFEDHLSADEVDARVRSHMEMQAAGISRSPRAMPAKVAPLLPMVVPAHARPDWEPPPPRPEVPFAQRYWDDYLTRSHEAGRKMYDRWRR